MDTFRAQDGWRKMDAPDRVGTCKKLREGQLLMQRYKYTYDQLHLTQYKDIAELAKGKSRVLAQRMVEHAKGCTICTSERVLSEPFFYGVYK